MTRTLVAGIVLGFLGALAGAGAFEATWTDGFGETTYRIAGPDTVVVGDTVRVTISAEDPFYPDDMVASPWSFLEDGSEIDGGFAVWLTDTTWSRTYEFVYDAPGDHTYTFTAQDMGHGGGGHNYEWFEISGTTAIVAPTATRTVSWGRVKVRFGR
jgi:hypothetical protein